MTIVRELPGIRDVRPLGRDTHRESRLVRLEGDEPRAAVLVRALDAQGERMVRLEAAALHRARGVGVVPLIDVVAEPAGTGLLRAHLVGARLSRLLGERERWHAGEVVAVLASLVAAVARSHRAGVAHGALSAAELVVTETGAVIGELGTAELFAPSAPEATLARIGAVGDDREALRSLALDLLRRVAGSRSRAAHSLADAVELAQGPELIGLLQTGLDDLAAPVTPAPHDPGPAPAVPAARMMPVVRGDGGDPEEDEILGAGSPGRISAFTARFRAWIAALPVARRRVLVAGAAALTAAAVLLALPGGGGPEQAAPDARGPHPGGSVSPPAAGPADGSETTEAGVAGSGATEAAITGDDPVAAAVALVEERAACFAAFSALCLEQVDQAGSAALAEDRAALRTLRDGHEAWFASVDPIDARLVERLGDSALVELGPETAPASLLLMRSEAGWRIRDWIAAEEAR
jgi:hypothetical protein